MNKTGDLDRLAQKIEQVSDLRSVGMDSDNSIGNYMKEADNDSLRTDEEVKDGGNNASAGLSYGTLQQENAQLK